MVCESAPSTGYDQEIDYLATVQDEPLFTEEVSEITTSFPQGYFRSNRTSLQAEMYILRIFGI